MVTPRGSAMGKASPARQDGDRRARIAAQRAAEQRTQRRNRLLLAGGAIVVVVAVVLTLGAAPGRQRRLLGTAAGGPRARPATSLTALTDQVTSVPAATLDQVGGGTVTAPPTTISGAALTSGGKPEMLYIGAEYCPYCAAERWAMIVALSRFGTFSGAGHHPLGRAQRRGYRRAVPEHRDLHVRERQLHEQVPHVHARSRSPPTSRTSPPAATPRCRRPRPRSRRSSRSTTRPTRARSRSSTTGTST